MSIGARSQSAKTYLEKNYESFMDCAYDECYQYPHMLMFYTGNLEDLIRHGLNALRETLQQDKALTVNNTSIGIVGPVGAHERIVPPEGAFRILEGDDISVYLESMAPKEAGDQARGPSTAPATTSAADAPAGQEGAPPPTGDDDVQMGE